MATKMYTTADRMHMQVLILYHYYYSLLSQSSSQPIRASIIVLHQQANGKDIATFDVGERENRKEKSAAVSLSADEKRP